MSFFLSSKPPAKPARARLSVPDKTKDKGANPPKDTAKRRDPAWLWLCVGLFICAGLGAGWFFGTRALRAQLAALHPAPTGQGAIHMDAFRAAPWVSEAEITALTREMGELLSSDPLDGEGLRKVARRLEQHLAVKQVLGVHRDAEGFVRIRAVLHQPAGLVHADGTLSPVDAQGHLLSAEPLAPEVADRLPIPRIEGVKTSSPYGKDVWKDAGLQAALPLILRLLEPERRALRQLTLGSEPGVGGKPRITLNMRFEPPGGPAFEVFWGLPVGEERGVDAPADDKLKALRGLYAHPEAFKGVSSPRFSVRSGSAKRLASNEIAETGTAQPANRPRTP